MPKNGGPISRASINYSRLLRSQNASGVVTATTAQGPMLINELWATAEDTTNLWTETIGGTGTSAAASSGRYRRLEMKAPANADLAAVVSKTIVFNPAASDGNHIWQRATLEFEAQLLNVASFDNTVSVIGGAGLGTERASNDSAAFILAADALNTLTDNGGTETVTVVSSPPTLTNVNLYKIVIRSGAVDFYVNGVLKNTHTDNLPADINRIWFRVVADAGLNAEMYLGPIRWYLEDTP